MSQPPQNSNAYVRTLAISRDAINHRGTYMLGQIPNTTNPLLPTLIESARWRLQRAGGTSSRG